ncbi:MAG: hypothetical protein JWP37_4547 [Mucilaginibacter sp.]|nr:hypothetical protein [Mucilaginibacter sp.]
MRKKLIIFLPALLVAITGFRYKPADAVVNYLNTSEVLIFNKMEYKLVWSSHPATNYYKQEYIPVKETLDRHKNLLLIDYLLIDTPAVNIAKIKAGEIKERMKTDVNAHFQLIENAAKKECILDFLLSVGGGNSPSVIEWSGYHYQNYTDKSGHKGIYLFGVSTTAYDDDVMNYLKRLKTDRQGYLKELVKYQVPDIEVK